MKKVLNYLQIILGILFAGLGVLMPTKSFPWRITFIVIGSVLLLVSVFREFLKSGQRARRKNRIESRSAPIFRFEYVSFVLNNYDENKDGGIRVWEMGSGITVWIHASNLGIGSSIRPDKWQIDAIVEGNIHTGHLGFRTQWHDGKILYPYRDRANNRMDAWFWADELLSRILSRTLGRNANVIGFLHADFPDIPFATLNRDSTIIELRCTDVFGKIWTLRNIIKDMKCEFAYYNDSKSTDVTFN